MQFCFALFCNAKSCMELESEIKHKFYALRHCQRSNKTMIGLANFDTLEECADFTRSKKGLAFNFSPKNRNKSNLYQLVKDKENKLNGSNMGSSAISEEFDEFFSCQSLDCPEYGNFSTVINDTRFDYYSMYSNPAPPANATCLPMIGMFVLFQDHSNYSVAYSNCSLIGGNLAHIVSESRTNRISKYLEMSTNSSTKERLAYVGLNETNYNHFYTSYQEPIKCFQYRAWAPGHPSEIRKPGCVAITPESSWKVFNCNRKLMFVCELFSSGPNPFVNNIKQKCSVQQPNNRFAPKRTEHQDQ
ncbi:unnamed protein product [Diamesa serratosioi]